MLCCKTMRLHKQNTGSDVWHLNGPSGDYAKMQMQKKNIYSKTESIRRSSHYNNHTRSACIFHANSECKQIMKLMQWPY